MPRIVWPTWLSMFALEDTRMNAGNFNNSCSCAFHLNTRIHHRWVIQYQCSKEYSTNTTVKDLWICYFMDISMNVLPFGVRQVNIGSKLDDFSNGFLLWAVKIRKKEFLKNLQYFIVHISPFIFTFLDALFKVLTVCMFPCGQTHYIDITSIMLIFYKPLICLLKRT